MRPRKKIEDSFRPSEPSGSEKSHWFLVIENHKEPIMSQVRSIEDLFAELIELKSPAEREA